MDPEKFKDQENTEEEEKPKAEEEKPEKEQEKPEQEQQKPRSEQEKPEVEEEKPKADPVEVNKAKNVVQFFKKTFSLIKLYPPENPSVAKSIDLFNNQIGEFLNEYEELSMQVGEFSFSFKGDVVFQDEERRKSLPFLFYRDGLRELSFHKGLDEEELHEFFRTISEVSDLPPEDADIVNSLWEKNLIYIRYYSIDEFLDQDIGEPTEEISPFDRVGFAKGKVEMTPDDEELFKKSLSLGIKEGREKGEGEYEGEEAGAGILPGTTVGAVSKDEIPEIESMLEESRKTPHMPELIDLLFELLFFEEREEEFAAITEVLGECHQRVLEKTDFSMGLSILSRIEELKKIISAKSEERAKLLGRISDSAKAPDSIASLRKIYMDGRVADFDTFFEYLENLGVGAFPVVAAIWEDSKFPFSRQKAVAFLEKIGKYDLDSLLNLARGQSASLTREIISILTTTGERTEISQLEDFVNHPDKAIRLDVIHALGKSGDEASNKILLRFLSDKDTEIRTAALKNLKYLGDSAALDYVKQMAHEKGFREKSRREKEAILKFLASTKSGETSTFLRSLLKKRKIFFPYKTNETRLCAVSALGVMATPEAADILKWGTKIRNKAIRQACNHELMKISSKERSTEEAKEKPKEETKEEQKEGTKEEQGS
jgi:HEAT repeat protein